MTSGSGRADLRAVAPLVEESAEELYEQAPCGYLSLLLDGTIVRMNRTLLEWLGMPHEDVVGVRRFQDLIAPGDRIYHETHHAPLLQMQGEVRALAVDFVRADGTRLPCLVNSVLKRGDGDAPGVVRMTVFEATDRRRYEQELLRARHEAERSEERARELARTLQRSLIPPTPPRIPGLDVGAAYRPAGEGVDVGGDFYDVFETATGDHVAVVGDVAGKGAGAAAVTALARYATRAVAIRTTRPSAVLTAVNEALLSDGSGRFCTMSYLRVHRSDAGVRLTVCSAGHPLPLRATADRGVEPVGRPGMLLGMFAACELHDEVAELAPGDVVLLYTDGVTEARGTRGFFGIERLTRLLQTLRSEPASEIAHAVVDEVLAFQGGVARDDIAVVALKRPATELRSRVDV